MRLSCAGISDHADAASSGFLILSEEAINETASEALADQRIESSFLSVASEAAKVAPWQCFARDVADELAELAVALYALSEHAVSFVVDLFHD